jgi:hypothetical protein
VLMHYTPNLPIKMAGVAYAYGVGQWFRIKTQKSVF